MQHRHREVLVSILKFYEGPVQVPRNNSPHAGVSTPQDHLLQQMLFQQHQHQRIPSPMNNGELHNRYTQFFSNVKRLQMIS